MPVWLLLIKRKKLPRQPNKTPLRSMQEGRDPCPQMFPRASLPKGPFPKPPTAFTHLTPAISAVFPNHQSNCNGDRYGAWDSYQRRLVSFLIPWVPLFSASPVQRTGRRERNADTSPDGGQLTACFENSPGPDRGSPVIFHWQRPGDALRVGRGFVTMIMKLHTYVTRRVLNN